MIQIQPLNGAVGSMADPYAGVMSVSTWIDGGLVTVTQSGDQPPYAWDTHFAVGPTGLVATHAGQLWIGLPSSN